LQRTTLRICLSCAKPRAIRTGIACRIRLG
jgi:hypothetical protein